MERCHVHVVVFVDDEAVVPDVVENDFYVVGFDLFEEVDGVAASEKGLLGKDVFLNQFTWIQVHELKHVATVDHFIFEAFLQFSVLVL